MKKFTQQEKSTLATIQEDIKHLHKINPGLTISFHISKNCDELTNEEFTEKTLFHDYYTNSNKELIFKMEKSLQLTILKQKK
jgi:hypothetical protein